MVSGVSISDRVMYEDVQPCTFPLGKLKAMVTCADDLELGQLSFCLTDGATIDQIQSLGAAIAAHTEKDAGEPHRPLEKEICLALFEDCYYRAVCTVSGAQFSMHFVDFGNTIHNLPAEKIRKLPRALAEYPIQSTTCFLKGTLPIIILFAANPVYSLDLKKMRCAQGYLLDDTLCRRLKDLVTPVNTYTLEVCSQNGVFHDVTMPEIYEVLRQEGLI